MELPEETFQIDGHEYRVICHSTSEATSLVMEIYSTLSGPGLSLIESLAAAKSELSLDSEASDLLEHVDMDKLPTQLRTALTDLDEQHLRELFRKTQRDGEDLSNDLLYDQAYAGNWGEWMKAIWEIVKVNGFLPFLSTIVESDG